MKDPERIILEVALSVCPPLTHIFPLSLSLSLLFIAIVFIPEWMNERKKEWVSKQSNWLFLSLFFHSFLLNRRNINSSSNRKTLTRDRLHRLRRELCKYSISSSSKGHEYLRGRRLKTGMFPRLSHLIIDPRRRRRLLMARPPICTKFHLPRGGFHQLRRALSWRRGDAKGRFWTEPANGGGLRPPSSRAKKGFACK